MLPNAKRPGAARPRPRLDATLRVLAPRWFILRNVHDARGTTLFQPRWAMSYLRGPMTRSEIKRAVRG